MILCTGNFVSIQSVSFIYQLWDTLKKSNTSEDRINEVKKYLEAKQNINTPNPKELNENLLGYAIKAQDFPLFFFLLHNKIGPNQTNENGDTPYHLVLLKIKKDKRLPWLKALYAYGANVNIANNKKEIPLYKAVEDKDLETVTFFLEKGANPDTTNDDGTSPLDLAKKYDNKDMIKLLEYALMEKMKNENFLVYTILKHDISEFISELDKKISDPNQKNKHSDTLYHIVLRNIEKGKRIPWLKALYKHGADINIGNFKGETPLYKAVEDGDLEAVTFFLEKGTDPEIKNYNQKSPLDLAKAYDYKKIITLLEDQQVIENSQVKKLEKEIKDNKKSFGGKIMIFKFAPSSNQVEPEYIIDTKALEAIGTYTDSEDNKQHYVIIYYNPLTTKKILAPIEISKERYDEKKQYMDKLWNDKNEQATRLLFKNFTEFPNITYTQGGISYYKEQYHESYDRPEGWPEISSQWRYRQKVANTNSESTNDKLTHLDKDTFKNLETKHQHQQKLLKKVHERYIKYGDEFADVGRKFPHYDISFNYPYKFAL